jgi:hypothetical protein
MTSFAHASHRLMEELVQTTQPSKPKPPKRPYVSSPEPEVERPEQVYPVPQLRDRQIGSDGDDSEHQLKRARLSRKNLALFDMMGRKKGTNTSSVFAPPESVDGSSTTTKSISTTTSGFDVLAHKNGILDPRHSKPPTNLENIQKTTC